MDIVRSVFQVVAVAALIAFVYFMFKMMGNPNFFL